eukprot:gene12648-biopygen7302
MQIIFPQKWCSFSFLTVLGSEDEHHCPFLRARTTAAIAVTITRTPMMTVGGLEPLAPCADNIMGNVLVEWQASITQHQCNQHVVLCAAVSLRTLAQQCCLFPSL